MKAGLQELEDLLRADPAGEEEEEPEEEAPEKEDEVDPAEAEAAKEAGEPIGKQADEEEKDMGENADKSLITQADFEKSLDRLASMANEGSSAESRKAFLLEKGQKGDLAEDERLELYGLLGGKVDQGGQDVLSRSVTSGLETNETLRKAYDVSDYLAEQHMELTKSLGLLSDHVEANSQRQHQFNLVLAKAIVDTGALVKAMSERLGVIARQPARQPLSQTGAQPLQKAFVGGSQAPQGDQLSKSQVLDAMDEMMLKSMDEGRNGISQKGMDIAMEVTKFESNNKMHPVMLQEVKEHIAGSRGNGR